ncbi:MAG: peptidylprolyl isomerase [Deltaproteobacteria bacterium]|nr:peptidylprolyl isomerase [Deltaproteobacteria bacterium]
MNNRFIFKRKSNGFYTFLLLILGLGGLFFVDGCDRIGTDPGPVVLVVGDQQLTADVLKQNLVFASEDLPISAKETENIKTVLLDNIIDRYLILEYAKKHGIDVSEKEFQARLNDIKKGYSESLFEETLLRKWGDPEVWIKRFKEQIVIEKVINSVTIDMEPPDYKEMKARFESNPNHYKRPEQVKFRQIFCRTRNKADELYGKIRSGENLAALARKYSEGPEAENGGEVGWVAKGTLEEPLDKMLFQMAQGHISPVTKGASGYHIFEIIDRRPGGFQAFSEIIGDIEKDLYRTRRMSFFKKWLQSLRSDITVKINQKAIDNLEFS